MPRWEDGELVFSGSLEDVRHKMGIHSKVSVRVGPEMDKAVEVLSVIPAVVNVQKLPGRLAVTFEDGAMDNGSIAKALVQAGIPVMELVPEQLRLDDAFLQLTRGLVH